MSHHQFIWVDPVRLKVELHLPWSDQKLHSLLVAIMVVERKLHIVINKNILLHLQPCSGMCAILPAYGIFLHVGFSNKKNPCCTLPVKFLKYLAALMPVVSSFCSWLCLRDFLSLPNPSRFEGQSLANWASWFSHVSALVCTQSNYWCAVALQQCFSVSACSALSRQLGCNEEGAFSYPGVSLQMWNVFLHLFITVGCMFALGYKLDGFTTLLPAPLVGKS